MIPGEMLIEPGEIELNAGRRTVIVTVANSGDRPIQVGSHFHFFEVNEALQFDRQLAYGMRLISTSLFQVSTELEEAARTIGASRARISRDITLPLIRHGLLGSWLLVFMIFEREYSTGVYLLAPGNEVIGAELVSLWQGGAIDVVAALSLVNIVLVGIGLAIALRFGVRLRD